MQADVSLRECWTSVVLFHPRHHSREPRCRYPARLQHSPHEQPVLVVATGALYSSSMVRHESAVPSGPVNIAISNL